MKRFLPFLFAVASCNAAVAQTITLTDPPYAPGYEFKNTIGARFQNDTTKLKAAWPKFWEWSKKDKPAEPKMTTEEVMRTGSLEGAYLNEYWKNDNYLQSGGQGQNYTDGNNSRARIILPHGSWNVAIPLRVSFGALIGQGNGEYADANGSTGGTRLGVNVSTWVSRIYAEQNAAQTENYMRKSGYMESFTVSDIRFVGPIGNTQPTASTKVSNGFAAYDVGEASSIEKCYAEYWSRAGYWMEKGTPGCMWKCSSFQNGLYGFAIIGASVNQFYGFDLSGDDNGQWLVYIDNGGTVVIQGLKYEVGTRQTWQRQGVLCARGAANVFVDGISAQVHGGVTIPYAFDVDTRQMSGGQYTSTLFGSGVTISNFRECGSTGKFDKYFKDDTYWFSMTTPNADNCRVMSSAWNSSGRMQCISAVVPTGKISGGAGPALSICTVIHTLVRIPGDSAACPPCPEPTVCPPPVVCPVCPTCPPATVCPPTPTELYGAWYKSGSCRAGLQTWRRQRVYFSGVNGKVTTITDSQPCSVTVHP